MTSVRDGIPSEECLSQQTCDRAGGSAMIGAASDPRCITALRPWICAHSEAEQNWKPLHG